MLVSAYSWLSYRQHLVNSEDTTVPNFVQLMEGFQKIATPQGAITKEVWIWKDATATYSRLFFGLALGCITSVALGVLMGCFSTLESIMVPPLSFLAKVPATAMLAVFFVVFGTGEEMFIAMIGFGVLPVLAQGIYLSAKHDVHDEHTDKAYTLGASNYEVITGVVLPQILPKIMESVRLQIGPAMVYLIAAEYMMADVGFGYRLRIQSRLLHMDVVYDYLILLGATGFLMDFGMIQIRKWLCPWYSRGK